MPSAPLRIRSRKFDSDDDDDDDDSNIHHHSNANNNNNKKKQQQNQSDLPSKMIQKSEVLSALLPVELVQYELTSMLKKHRVVIIIGETGSGKTTKIPQFCLDAFVYSGAGGSGSSKNNNNNKNKNVKTELMVGVTQPRRVAAQTVASYVAKCRGNSQVGEEVGYCVRFDEKTSQKTRLKFLTDGMLLRELLVDPLLSKYCCIILDEAHERTVNGDVLFGLLKRLFYERRKDLRLVVMSATLDSEGFSKFWNNAPVGYIPGRAFPVDIKYTNEPQSDYVEAAITTIVQIHISEAMPGDILCFLTGADEIEDTRKILEERKRFLKANDPSYKVVPIYASLTSTQQLEAFKPAPEGVRKIVLATNIAETSITIDGIVYVVDTGLVKSRQYNPATGLETLAPIVGSKAQARQRAGRAGRTRPGKCFRLYQEEAFLRVMPDQTVPEILRCNLSSVVLQMKSLNIEDVLNFDFIDRPSEELILRALEELCTLGALDEENEGKITNLGRELVKFPVEPMEAKCIVKGIELGCADEVCVILAMMAAAEQGLFLSSGPTASANSSSSSSFSSRGKKQKGDDGENNNNNNNGGGGTGGVAASAFSKGLGDHLTHLSVYESYTNCGNSKTQKQQWCHSHGVDEKQIKKASDIELQLRRHVARLTKKQGQQQQQQSSNNNSNEVGFYNSDGSASARLRIEAAAEYPNIRRAFTAGFFSHSAYFDAKAREYKTAIGRDTVYVHPGSVMFSLKKKPSLVLFHVAVQTSKKYMRDVMAIREDFLFEAAPNLFARPTSSSSSSAASAASHI